MRLLSYLLTRLRLILSGPPDLVVPQSCVRRILQAEYSRGIDQACVKSWPIRRD